MKNRLLKTFTSLVLTVLMVISVMPAFAITIGAAGESTATLTFDDTAKRTTLSTSQQVWEENGITFTNKSSSNNVADYSKPVRLYKNSTVTIEYDGGNITVIEVVCSSSSYASALNKSITGSTVSGSNVTINLDGTSDTFSFTLGAQVRVNSIKVSYTSSSGSTDPEPDCQHTNTEDVAEVPATCTTHGTTAGVKCTDCGATISGCEETPLADHNYVNGACSVCGKKKKDIYKLVTNVNELKIGNKIIIVASDSSFALSTAQNTNNRGYVTITKTGNTIESVDNLQVLTLKEGTKSGTFALYTGDGYLYAASSSSNHLKTETELSDNSSWNISITGNVATIKAQGTNTKNWLRYNSSNKIFSCYSSGQVDVLIYKFVCDHSNTEDVAEVPATCTEPGTAAGDKCLDCGEIISGCDVIPAKGHKDDNTDGYCDVCKMAMCGENHNWNETERKDATCTEDGSVKYECSVCHETKIEPLTANGHTEVIDEAVAATCTATGLTEGKHCSVCDTVLVEQTETPIIGHNYVDGTCTMCGKAEPVLPFKVGDVVIFTGSQTNSGKNYEFSGFDSKQTYGCAEEYSGYPAGMFPITIVEGNQSGTFAFKNGDNYITRNEGNIELSTELGDNSSWIAELDGDGNLVIKSYTGQSYKLQFNANNPRFKVYTSNQQPIKVVKYPTIKTFGLSLNEGVTVKVTFDIPEAWLNSNTGAKVVFSNGEKDIKTIDVVAGVNVYSVKLTPAQINDALTVKITDAEGKLLVAEKDVSVSAYRTKAAAAGASEQLIALLDAALTYSSVADGTYNGKDLTNNFDGVADHTHSGELFTSFAGQLGTYASVYINVDTGKVPESGDTLVLTVGGTGIINDDIAKYITKDRQIVISGLFPANFDDTIYIAASNEGSNATFTFNSYLKAIYNDNSSDQPVKNLAVATYLYGLAAEAYLATLK